jgi:beta-xylosidase
MVRKVILDLDHPMDQAGLLAKEIVEKNLNVFADSSKDFINDQLIDNLMSIAMQSRIDDSPLVVKQKIRNLIRAEIRKKI